MNRSISSKLAVGLIAMAGALAALPAWAEPKIGVVDPQRLLEESPQGKAMLDSLRSEFAPRERTLQAQQQSLKSKQDKLQKDGATMSEDQRARAEKELRDGMRDFERARGELQDDVLRERRELFDFLLQVANLVPADDAALAANDHHIADGLALHGELHGTAKLSQNFQCDAGSFKRSKLRARPHGQRWRAIPGTGGNHAEHCGGRQRPARAVALNPYLTGSYTDNTFFARGSWFRSMINLRVFGVPTWRP